MRWNKFTTLAVAAGTCLAAPALAQVDNPELEPNDFKAQATGANSGGAGMSPGDTISGTTTGLSTTVAGPTSADYFRVRTAAAMPAIYRYRLTLNSSTLFQTGTIRGLNQVAGVPGTADNTAQTALTAASGTLPPRTVQWFGFGMQEEIYYRVTGTTSSTGTYTATLARDVITPTAAAGTVAAGTVTIRPTAATDTAYDTDFWIYDSNFNAIVDAGHDDVDGTGITRNLGPGTYYIAAGNFNTANNLGSPPDDTFRVGTVLDFPNAIICGSTSTLTTAMAYDIVSSAGTATASAPRAGAFDIVWLSFVVEVPNFPTGTASANPNPVLEGQATVLTVAVSPAMDGQATSHTVVADASALGGSSSLSLLDDGIAPDAAAGDNIFSASVLATAAPGARSVMYTVADNLGRSSGGTLAVTVNATASGACCTGTTCVVTRQFPCESGGGTFLGAGTNCGDFTYTIVPGGSALEDISGTGTVISATPGDDANFAVTLGFPFTYYGTVYNTINVGTNGNAQFPPSNSTTFANVAIPSTALPNNMLAVLWDDFNFNINTNDNLQHEVRGTAGVDLRHIIQWTNVSQFGLAAGTDFNTFQIVLFENGTIEYRYGAIAADFTVNADTGGATVGVEDAGGTSASVQFAQGASPVQSNTSLSIRPVQPPSPCMADPCAAADFNGVDGLNADDLSDYITCFFTEAAFPGACPEADFNGVDGVNADDLSDYITLYFGCV